MSADDTLKDVMDKFKSHGCSASKTSKGDKVFFARLRNMPDETIRHLLRNYSGKWNTSGQGHHKQVWLHDVDTTKDVSF